MTAEAMVLRKGTVFCQEIGLKEVQFESNYLHLVKAVNELFLPMMSSALSSMTSIFYCSKERTGRLPMPLENLTVELIF